MRLANISLNNLGRRRTRVALVVIALTIAVATSVLLVTVTNTTKADIDRKLDEFGANIVIFPKSDALTLSYGGITVRSASYDVKDLRVGDADKILTIKNRDSISAVAPKIVGVAKIDDREALLVGVRFNDEMQVKKWWSITGKIPENDGGAVLGSQAARVFKKRLGDNIIVNGTDLQVAGIIRETGEQDDSLVFTDLAKAQAILGKPGRLSLIEVSALCSSCPIEEIDKQISGKLPHAKVATIKQAVESKMSSINQLTEFSGAVTAILAIIGAMIVLITMIASVNERVREIGIFRAVGFRRSHIAQIVVLEAAIIGLLGGLLGYAIGAGVALVLTPRIAELTVPVSLDPLLFVEAVGLSVVVGILGSLYPAMTAAKLDPSSALRTI